MRNRYTAQQRRELIELVTTGGVTVAEAATRMGVKPSTAYQWAREAAPSRPIRRQPEAATFVRLIPSGDSGGSLALRIGAVAIEVRRNFDGELLRAVVDALGGGAA